MYLLQFLGCESLNEPAIQSLINLGEIHGAKFWVKPFCSSFNPVCSTFLTYDTILKNENSKSRFFEKFSA